MSNTGKLGQLPPNDANGVAVTLECSPVVGEYGPWASEIQLGVDNADPHVLARDAHLVGISVEDKRGWVPFPVPACVYFTTRMNLNRDQVEHLVSRLQQWLATGEFTDE